MDPVHLMAVMSFETGETFSSSVRNRHTGATGLIQFMPQTARGMGTSTSALSRLSPERQLDYVERYLEPYAGRMNTVEDAYMAVLWPAAVGRGPNHVLFRRGTRAYRQNSGLDINRNGYITSREAANKVRAKIG
ncbi:MAG: lytic transglycosylase domain-containing protein [Deltaproteobacteria bacterium]|nr:MAG: lytic transglycosylase domain-containing protein [Deltaproteobacteria bacterium]